MKKIIRLTESDLTRIVKQVIKKQFLSENNSIINDITYFETSKGSRYIRLSDGRLRRWKSYHADTGGEDMGLHEWHDNSIFVDPKYEKQANAVEFMQNYYDLRDMGLSKNKDGKMILMLYKDGVWSPATYSDAYPKYTKVYPEDSNKILGWEYVNTPTVGYHVVDFSLKNNRLRSYHFGSEVSIVEPKGELSDDVKKLFFPSFV